VLAMSLEACSSSWILTTGMFPDVSLIGKNLKRGVSTKADVEQLLGQPTGRGGALLPPSHVGYEAWLYESVQGGAEMKSERGQTPGLATMSLRQQIVLIFFKDGLYHGYLWFLGSSSGSMTVQMP